VNVKPRLRVSGSGLIPGNPSSSTSSRLSSRRHPLQDQFFPVVSFLALWPLSEHPPRPFLFCSDVSFFAACTSSVFIFVVKVQTAAPVQPNPPSIPDGPVVQLPLLQRRQPAIRFWLGSRPRPSLSFLLSPFFFLFQLRFRGVRCPSPAIGFPSGAEASPWDPQALKRGISETPFPPFHKLLFPVVVVAWICSSFACSPVRTRLFRVILYLALPLPPTVFLKPDARTAHLAGIPPGLHDSPTELFTNFFGFVYLPGFRQTQA